MDNIDKKVLKELADRFGRLAVARDAEGGGIIVKELREIIPQRTLGNLAWEALKYCDRASLAPTASDGEAAGAILRRILEANGEYTMGTLRAEITAAIRAARADERGPFQTKIAELQKEIRNSKSRVRELEAERDELKAAGREVLKRLEGHELTYVGKDGDIEFLNTREYFHDVERACNELAALAGKEVEGNG